jgi:diguanylate cyclase (GGDEF)-like protein
VTTHPIKRLLRPEAFLLVLAVVLAVWNRWERSAADIIRAAPYAFALAGVAVAWRLRRSRVVFSLAILIAGYLLISRWLPRDPDAFQFAAILVPLNLAAVALLPERGSLTQAGLWHWGAILGQAAAVALILTLGDAKTPIGLLRHTLVPASLTAWSPLDQPALLAFVLAAGLVTGGRLLAAAATGTGYLWTLVATFLAFNARSSLDRTVFLAAAAGILVISAVELSYMLAYHDGLTGLPGRRALNEALERLSGTYTIAMADVDHFKRFNDTYGHEVGDEVLRTVATRLAQALPEGEVYRYGGEEFAVLFGGARRDTCLPLLERAREAVAKEPFAIRRRLRPRKRPKKPRARGRRQEETITVSIGAAERGGKLEKADDVVHAADQALYRAKEGGRNQVRA